MNLIACHCEEAEGRRSNLQFWIASASTLDAGLAMTIKRGFDRES